MAILARKPETSDRGLTAALTLLGGATPGADAEGPSVKQTTNVSVLLPHAVEVLSVTRTVYVPGPVNVRSAELLFRSVPFFFQKNVYGAVPPVTVACRCAVPRHASARLISTDGFGLMVIVIVSVAGPHDPAGSLVVNVSVTEPALISAWEGVYVAFNVFAFGLNVPVPPLQDPLSADPPKLPLRVTAGLLAQTV